MLSNNDNDDNYCYIIHSYYQVKLLQKDLKHSRAIHYHSLSYLFLKFDLGGDEIDETSKK
jgi:hypothetical protein